MKGKSEKIKNFLITKRLALRADGRSSVRLKLILTLIR